MTHTPEFSRIFDVLQRWVSDAPSQGAMLTQRGLAAHTRVVAPAYAMERHPTRQRSSRSPGTG
jgi:hypothetical protein